MYVVFDTVSAVYGVGNDKGFQNPQGSGVGYVRVRVRVGISVPLQNPYP
jgi:hypothetical protein